MGRLCLNRQVLVFRVLATGSYCFRSTDADTRVLWPLPRQASVLCTVYCLLCFRGATVVHVLGPLSQGASVCVVVTGTGVSAVLVVVFSAHNAGGSLSS